MTLFDLAFPNSIRIAETFFENAIVEKHVRLYRFEFHRRTGRWTAQGITQNVSADSAPSETRDGVATAKVQSGGDMTSSNMGVFRDFTRCVESSVIERQKKEKQNR